MFRNLARPDEKHRNVPAVTVCEIAILVDIHFTQTRAKLLDYGLDRGLCFFDLRMGQAVTTRMEREPGACRE